MDRGEHLHLGIQADCFPEEFAKAFKKQHGAKAGAIAKALANFSHEYQTWYSEAKVLLRQLLPDSLADFGSQGPV